MQGPWLDASVRPGEWPDAPSTMSYSVLEDLESCPRRWALQHASYPALWGGHGYPRPFSASAVVGRTVHRSLEKIFKHTATIRTDDDATASPAARALRELGGLSAIVSTSLDEVLAEYEGNPRIAAGGVRPDQVLKPKLPAMRMQVQSMLSRSLTRFGEPRRTRAHGDKPAGPLPTGTYSEVTVNAPEIQWKGIVDLLVIEDDRIEVLDFKTGDHSENHVRQLYTYAALWRLDNTKNPTGRSITSLTLSYAGGELTVDVPTSTELDVMTEELTERAAAARTTAAADPPPAKPNADTCRFCAVRHLCDEYWSTVPWPAPSPAEGWHDADVVLTQRNGAHSWIAQGAQAHSTQPPIILRFPSPPDVIAGTRLRILGGVLSQELVSDEADGHITMSIVRTSEVFRYSR